MNFEKIELIGFKSFADKQEIRFNDGVTGIVGPNGCGKSNISDAIRWVLGEQSAKSLRGSSMQDVIFNGTQNRKSLSYCEVSLYFDNTNKIFPSLDYTEVCMTRKLFRSGESEYYLNKKPCRMKDITDLLHECGVSKNGYSIIGQGKIAEIMNSKPEDRRSIFEEAVGIAGSKAKKIENERKLQRTRENIIRLIDISSALEQQLAPLEKSAEKTRTFLQLSDELKYHEVNTYLYKAENSHTVKEKINARISGLEEEQAARRNDMEAAQAAFTEHQNKISETDDRIGVLNEEILKRTVGLTEQMGVTNVYNEKINFLKSEIQRLKADCREKLEKIDLLAKSYADKQQKTENSKIEISAIEKRIKDISATLVGVLQELSEGETKAADAQRQVLQSVESLADIKLNIGALSGEKNAISDKQKEVAEKVKELAAKKAAFEAERMACSASLDELNRRITSLKSSIDDEESAVRSTNEYVSDVTNKIYTLNSDISSLKATQNVYQGLKDSFTGYPDSVKNLMLAAKNNPALGTKVKGLVASIIKTEAKYEVAVETLLGGAINNIVTATPDDAQFLIDYLKRQGGGRITFLPVTSMKPRFDGAETVNALKERGSLGLAASVVRYDKYYDNVVRYLLGNTLICDTIENAVAIAKKYRFAFKIATLDGDVVNPSGSMSGGSRRREGSNVLSTDRRLEQIVAELKRKNDEMNALMHNKEQSLAQVNSMVEELDKKNSELVEARQNAVIFKEKVASLEASLADTDKELDVNRAIMRSINDRLGEITKQYNDIEVDNEKLDKARESASSDAMKHQSHYDELKVKRDELIAENTDLQAKLASLKSEVIGSDEELRRMEADKTDCSVIIEKNEQNIAANEDIIGKIKIEIEKITLSTEEQTGLNKLRAELAEMKELKVKLNEQVAQDDLKKQAFASEISKLSERIMAEKIDLTKVDTEIEYMQQRISDEYQLTYETCLPLKDPEYNVVTSQQEINRLRRRISALGSINANAIDDFNKLNEQYQDLMTQKSDLENAEDDLKTVIKSITDEMLKTFNEGFEQIRMNFKKIFKELFGGGSADLLMDYSQVEDPLDAGVEIVAEPPGKKLTRISLLSGGEQALTATAILFAILRLRPMPFCVLDEIEAPLDDANVERVASYLQKFADDTQFVVITHKKVTMEKANTLFGVTMEEKGVSKIISVNLADIKNNSDLAN